MASILSSHPTYFGTKLVIDAMRVGAWTGQTAADGNGSLAGRNTR